MKKSVCLLMVFMNILLPICARAVTQEEYEKVITERNALYQQLIDAGIEPVIQIPELEKPESSDNEVATYEGGYTEIFASEDLSAAMADNDYFAIAGILQDYLSTAKSPTDSANVLASYYVGVGDIINRTFWDIDAFDGKKTLRWNNYSLITDDICISPYLEDNNLYCRMGFINDDWVFFDKVAISLNGEIIFAEQIEYKDRVTDTIGNGQITEWTDISMPYHETETEIILGLRSEGRIVIRFSNSKDEKKYDHILDVQEAAVLADFFELNNAIVKIEKMHNSFQSGKRDINQLIKYYPEIPIYPIETDPMLFARLIGDGASIDYIIENAGRDYFKGKQSFSILYVSEVMDGYSLCTFPDIVLMNTTEIDFSSLKQAYDGTYRIMATVTYLGTDNNQKPVFWLGYISDDERAQIDLNKLTF